MAQIGPRLRFGGGRPQHKGQSLPRLRRIAMKDQICDQGMETVGIDSRDGASREADPQVAEQVDPHACRLRVYDVQVAPGLAACAPEASPSRDAWRRKANLVRHFRSSLTYRETACLRARLRSEPRRLTNQEERHTQDKHDRRSRIRVFPGAVREGEEVAEKFRLNAPSRSRLGAEPLS